MTPQNNTTPKLTAGDKTRLIQHIIGGTDRVTSKQLRIFAAKMGMTNEQLADALGVTPRSLRNWFYGVCSVPVWVGVIISYWLAYGPLPKGWSRTVDAYFRDIPSAWDMVDIANPEKAVKRRPGRPRQEVLV